MNIVTSCIAGRFGSIATYLSIEKKKNLQFPIENLGPRLADDNIAQYIVYRSKKGQINWRGSIKSQVNCV